MTQTRASIATSILLICLATVIGAQVPFVTTWQTNQPGDSCSSCITIPTDSDYDYDYSIDWNGDGILDVEGVVGDYTIDFQSPGQYTIHIYGLFPTIYMDNDGDRLKLISIDQWGENIWASLRRAFDGCELLDVLAQDVPDLRQVSDMRRAFADCSSLTADLADWDVSTVHRMDYLFSGATSFNGDIGVWDVSSLRFMPGMFRDATAFNQDLDSWQVSSVLDMSFLFQRAKSFDGDISTWQTNNVTNMRSLFQDACSFNQDLSNWDVSKVTRMDYLFSNATSFDGCLATWDVSRVFNMRYMFANARSFSCSIADWDVSGVRQMSAMFSQAVRYDHSLENWDISNVEVFNGFDGNRVVGFFDQSGFTCENYSATLAAWSLASTSPDSLQLQSLGMTYNELGQEARALLVSRGWQIEQDVYTPGCVGMRPFVTTWVTNLPGGTCSTCVEIRTDPLETYAYEVDVDYRMGEPFEPDTVGLSGDFIWDFGREDTVTIAIRGIYPGISVFDPAVGASPSDAPKLISIDQWGDIVWYEMSSAFYACTNMDVNANDSPNLEYVDNLSQMFYACSNLTANLNSWDVSRVRNMSQLFYNCTNYNAPLDAWDVAAVGNMSSMFEGAIAFDQDLSSWDVAKASNMGGMFGDMQGRKMSFNGNIESWQTGNVRSMSRMFQGASSFNQNISNWNVAAVETTIDMFAGAIAFAGDLSYWDASKMENLQRMFVDASAFDSDLGSWNLQRAVVLGAMLSGSGLSCQSYTNTLTGWAANDRTVDDMVLAAAGLQYQMEAIPARQLLEGKGWSFLGDTLCPSLCEMVTCQNGDVVIDLPGSSVAVPLSRFVGEVDSSCGLSFVDTVAVDTMYVTCADVGEQEITIYDLSDSSIVCTALLTVKDAATCSDYRPFVITVEASDNSSIITLPVSDSYSYDYEIDWDNDGLYDTSGIDATYIHAFDEPGQYTLAIRGNYPAPAFGRLDDSSRLQIVEVVQWGDNAWLSLQDGFTGCTRLQIVAKDSPDLSRVQSTAFAFDGCEVVDFDASSWRVSGVSDMTGMFRGAGRFDSYLGGWDMSSVRVASQMLDNTSISCPNYSSTIIGWASQIVNLEQDVRVGVDGLAYDPSIGDARDRLQRLGWLFEGDVPVESCYTQTLQHDFSNVYVFPNPTSDYLYIAGIVPNDIRVVDMWGRSQAIERVTPTCLEIRGLTAGVYVLMLLLDEGAPISAKFSKL